MADTYYVEHAHIPWYPASHENIYPLGRNIKHDSRSLAYAHQRSGRSLTSQLWTRHTAILNQGNVGSCFPPGTRIRMADGSERPIEDVRLGECVVTAEGNTGRVTRTMLRDEDGGLVRLIAWGHAHLRMTREHPVLTSRGYVAAGELQIGDEVALPRYMTAAPLTQISTAAHVERPSHRLTRGQRWQGLPGRKGLQAGAHTLPEKIDLDARFGRLIGLFLAEGNCDNAKAIWSLNISERDTLGAEITGMLASYGAQSSVRELPIHNSCKVTVYGQGWSRLLSSLCGDGAGQKRPHPHLMSGPAEFLEAMLDGWLAGDGHVRTRYYKKLPVRGDTEGVTISADLALAMYDIAQALGRRPVIDWRESPQNRHAKVRHPRWTLTMAAGGANYKSRQDAQHVWRKVRELRIEDYVGPVYNLSIEGDESYVAEGVGVHNCTGNEETGALGTDPLFAALPPGHAPLDESLALFLYSAAEVIDGDGPYPPQDNGSSGLSVAQAAKNDGLISGFTHCLSLADVLDALETGPVGIGSNWYDSMDKPDSSGLVTISPNASIRGGHEYLCRGKDITQQLVFLDNSWGTSFGVNGSFSYSYATLERLLAEQGDGTVSIPINAPAPVPVPVPPVPVPVPVPPSPTPVPPTPTPVPPGPAPTDDADQTLANATATWAFEHHTGDNRRAARAVQEWLSAKGFV